MNNNKLKKLVIYYSLEGNTRFIAEKMAHGLGADILELKPEKELNSDSGMRYLWGGGQVIMKEIPKLKEYKINLADYRLIAIGTPIWAFNFTPPIRTFLRENKIVGKKIIFFCTHAGAKGKTFANLSAELVGNEILGEIDFYNVLRNKEKSEAKLKEFIDAMKNKIGESGVN